jgi:urease accessory protein
VTESELLKQVSSFADQTNSGSCPHAAIREDISANLHVLEDLQRLFKTEILLIESGGDNLAANYSRELADYIIYVV